LPGILTAGASGYGAPAGSVTFERPPAGPVTSGITIGYGTGPAREPASPLPQVQDPEQAARIVPAAHQVCPYSNATRGNIDVVLTVNGHDIG